MASTQHEGKLGPVSVRASPKAADLRELLFFLQSEGLFLKYDNKTLLRIPFVFINMIRGCPQLLCEQLFLELLGPLISFCLLFCGAGMELGGHVSRPFCCSEVTLPV